MVMSLGGVKNEKKLQYDYLLFDLDDTLYPLSSGISAACRQNIEEYLVERFGLEPGVASELCSKLYREYGTTMAGLVAKGYKVDFDEYHSFIHGRLPYHVLRPDQVLRSMLLSMPQRKWIFTNADVKHAHKVLKRLGLEDCFEGIICFETIMEFQNLNTAKGAHTNSRNQKRLSPIRATDKNAGTETVICKPSEEAMRRAIAIAGVDPSRTLFFDDSVRNIAAGKTAGLHTVLVGSSTKVEGADYAIESIHNLRKAIPEIWQELEKGKLLRKWTQVTSKNLRWIQECSPKWQKERSDGPYKTATSALKTAAVLPNCCAVGNGVK